MKVKTLIIIFVIAAVAFAVGKWLQTLYGFDPPYGYLYAGMALQAIAVITGITSIIVFMIKKK